MAVQASSSSAAAAPAKRKEACAQRCHTGRGGPPTVTGRAKRKERQPATSLLARAVQKSRGYTRLCSRPDPECETLLSWPCRWACAPCDTG